MVKKPEGRNQPDWASKIHIATSPCYYHNYLLGELLASQLNHYVAATVLKSDNFRQSYYGNAEVGKFLTDKVFMPGSRWYWNDMIEKATGEKLTAKYYADQFVK
jgi:peptidyl-dipeptidase A